MNVAMCYRDMISTGSINTETYFHVLNVLHLHTHTQNIYAYHKSKAVMVKKKFSMRDKSTLNFNTEQKLEQFKCCIFISRTDGTGKVKNT